MEVVRRGAALVTVCLVVLTPTACGVADDVGRVLAQHAEDLTVLARTRWAASSTLPRVVTVSREAVEAKAAALAAAVRDVPAEDRWEVVSAGCELWSLQEVGNDPDKAVSYVRDKFRNAWVYEQQVRDLAEELRKTHGTRDQSVILGRALVCTAADAQNT